MAAGGLGLLDRPAPGGAWVSGIPEYIMEPMQPEDGQAVIGIYNYFVLHSLAAYPDQKVPKNHFKKFWDMIHGYPAIMVKLKNGEPLGFGFLHPYRPIHTMQHTAEVTYFILPEYTGYGIGTKILTYLESMAPEFGIEILLANIASKNRQSLNFHRKNGFIECGRFKRIIRKNGLEFDMVWMQKYLKQV
jgi:phosphinothricin acetyltransferase